MDNNKDLSELIKKNTGNSDLITRQYFDRFVIEERIIGSDLSDITMNFLGKRYSMPLMLGVIGGYSRMGDNALMKSAEAASELNTPIWVSSHVSDEQLKNIVKSCANVVYVCKPFRDQQQFISRIKEVAGSGVIAIATDIDHAYGKDGEYDRQKETEFGPKSVDELQEAANSIDVPFIVKGVLSVSDALKAREAGAKAIVVSHHHSIMNFAVPPMMVLPDIREALGKDYEIVADCGVVSGADAFKLLASGASSVCVARAFMAPLARNGKEGVVELFNEMKGGLREYLNRTGSKGIYHIDPKILHKI